MLINLLWGISISWYIQTMHRLSTRFHYMQKSMQPKTGCAHACNEMQHIMLKGDRQAEFEMDG